MGAPVWTEEENEILRKYYPDNGIDYCLKLLPNRTKGGSLAQKIKLGIKTNRDIQFKRKPHKDGYHYCTKCNQYLEIEKFNKFPGAYFGLRSYCKKCQANQDRTRNHKRYRDNLALYMWTGARKRSSEKNIEFSIQASDIIIPEYCPVLGIKLEICGKSNSPTLDRIDNNKGYIKGNILVISNKANRIKNNATIEEVEKVLQYMKSFSTTFTSISH